MRLETAPGASRAFFRDNSGNKMPDLILRPSEAVPGKPWALQLRWHECLGETEYHGLGRLDDGTARAVAAAGPPAWLSGEPSDTGEPGPDGEDARPGLFLRPAGGEFPGKWSLVLRSVGGGERTVVARMVLEAARDIVAAGAAYWMFGEPPALPAPPEPLSPERRPA